LPPPPLPPKGEALWLEFEERKMEVARAKAGWRTLFILNILILFGMSLFIFFQLTVGIGWAAASWLEFAVTLPLIYSAVFAHIQHGVARDYLEEYSFKTLVAKSLESYCDFLKKNVDKDKIEEQKKYIDFIIASMKDLFTPPREIISKHPVKEDDDIKVGVVEKLGDVFQKFIPKI